MKSDLCQPRGSKADLGAMADARRAHNPRKAAEIAERMIDEGFANAEAHMSLVDFYTQLNQPEKAKFHTDVFTGLMRSILKSGDGKTTETAFEIITAREELLVLIFLKLPQSGSSSFFESGTHRYLKVPLPERTVFFNVDAAAAKSDPR